MTELAEADFVVVDCETTGLSASDGDGLVAIGAVHCGAATDLGQEFMTLVNPGRSIPPTATAIHHLTDADVAQAPSPKLAVPALAKFAGNRVWVGHNLAFDLSFLSLGHTEIVPRSKQLDTMLLSSVIWPTERHNLPAVCGRLEVPLEFHHHALADAQATAAVLLKQLPLLAQLGITTLAAAQEAMLTSAFAQRLAARRAASAPN